MGIFWQEQFLDSSGNPYSGVKVYHYEPGTTTLKNMFEESTDDTAVAQPLVGDSAGTVSAYMVGPYRLLIKTNDEVTIYDYDPVDFAASSQGVIDGSIASGTDFESIVATLPSSYEIVVVPSWVTSYAVLNKTASGFDIAYGAPVPGAGYTRSWFVKTAS